MKKVKSFCTKPYLLEAVLFLVLLIQAGCTSANQEEIQPTEMSVEQEMESFLQAHADTGEFMGAVLVARGDEILKSGGYGMANLEHDVPNTDQTIFRLASLSKPFTAAAVLQLQEQGLLNVNDTVDQYLPDYPHGGEITISQLLNHTSGIPDYEFLRPSAALRSPISLDELMDIFVDLPLEFPPGSQWSYSNSGYVVLTAIIESVSGQGYADYLAQHIFQPLGMDSTEYEDLDAILAHRAAGYTLGSDGYHNSEYFDISNATGAGGLVSTVNDMYKWDRALYGDEVLGQASREAFFTPTANITEGMDYTYAGAMIAMPDRNYIQFNGEINGFFTASMRYPEEALYVVVLSNLQIPIAQAVAKGLAAIAFGEPYELPEQRNAVEIDPVIYEKYAGVYQVTTDITIDVTTQDGRLFAQNGDSPKFEIYPESETEFYAKVADLKLRFQEAADGTITGMIISEGSKEYQGLKLKESK